MRRWTAAAIVGACLAAAGEGSPARESGGARPDGPDWEEVSREAIGLLRSYIRIPSVNPPADTRAAAAFLKEILEREGIPVRTYESSPGKVNLLARLSASRPDPVPARPILLLHHMDVVPVDAARWPVDPFGGELKDGFVHGRGAADMKGAGILHLLAMLTLKRQAAPLSRDLLLLATADEETGGHGGALWMIEHHWEQMDPEYVLDEGGFGSRDLLAADGRLVFAVSVAEKKLLWLKLRAEGTAGHGSQPTQDNPNELLVRALAHVSGAAAGREDAPPAVVTELAARIGGLADNTFTRAIRRDTVSLTTLRAGVGEPAKANVIPSVAEATLDCRLLPGTDVGRFLAGLFPPGSGLERVQVETIHRVDQTPVTPHDTPMFAALEEAIRREHPEAVVAPFLIPYGTDSNAFRIRGARSYGLTPVVVDGSIIASMHSDAEKVPASELVRGVRILHDAILTVAGR
ncbi:MAG TPA: M20/M25/M40 family metallo-hydrolase [Candidatus Polarisedimenticolia bacterium]|nr:M20/M25/M40 family metallo-hydrolase [Candidatus Polarisedimenticolia bacterium]